MLVTIGARFFIQIGNRLVTAIEKSYVVCI